MAPRRNERRARARALQAIYAWDMRRDEPLPKVAGRVFDDLAVTAEVRAIALPLVRMLDERRAEIDASLEAVMTNWRLDRLGGVERCVLRLAAAELVRGETPPRVVLKEAVHFAERFGSEESAKFVNGVLDSLARRQGRL
ncbi:MAG: transcription antitermination factor NusB [Gemmatimonadetes bacterium]|nr:transcription antitermination factor NusB [Gemmatimonadota bacterium]